MARNFNGTTDKITATNPLPSPAAFTMTAWTNPNSTTQSTNAGVCGFGAYQATNGCGHMVLNTTLEYQVFFGGLTVIDVQPITLNAWTHLAVTWDGTTANVYVNGVLIRTHTNGLATPTTQFCIGSIDAVAGSFYNGRTADVALWNVALTAPEVLQLGRGLSRPSTIRFENLFGWWPLMFPSFGGGVAPDISGFNHNGVLSGTTLVPDPPFISRRSISLLPNLQVTPIPFPPPPPPPLLMAQIVL